MTRLAVLAPASPIRSFSLVASLVAGLMLGFSAPAVAEAEDTMLTGKKISNYIKTMLKEHKIAGTPQINPKEKHNPCPGGITAAPLFKNWKTIKVTCPASPQWRLLVRVEMDDAAMATPAKSSTSRAHGAADQDSGSPAKAIALTRSMVKGEVILEGDLMMVPLSAQQNYGVFHNASDVIGRRVRTPITAKAPIKSRQLEPKYLVEEKKPVIIALSSNGIYVEMSGISLQNGQLGEAIKVENMSSGKTITGKVIGFRKISPMH